MPQGCTVRQRLRDFLAVPWLGHDGLSAQIIADDKRWALLRRCSHDKTGAALALRYGQTTHIVELTRDHLIAGEARGIPASENPAELWQE